MSVSFPDKPHVVRKTTNGKTINHEAMRYRRCRINRRCIYCKYLKTSGIRWEKHKIAWCSIKMKSIVGMRNVRNVPRMFCSCYNPIVIFTERER